MFASLSSPVAVVRERTLDHNVAAMAQYVREHGALLAPHGKTTMTPAIFERQLAAGAWAITVADIPQARVARRAGVPRVLIANQVVDPVGIRWVAEGHRRESGSVVCFVDSLAGVDALDAALGDARALPVMLEVGAQGGRAGARDAGAALEVARAVAASDALVLTGVAAFEGIYGHGDGAEARREVSAFLEHVRAVAQAVDGEGLLAGERLLSAGGSMYFDLVLSVLAGALPGARVLLRSGCYVVHDHGVYGERSPAEPRFEPALEVWGHVLSRPEPGLAIADVGRRHVSTDAGMPRPLRRARDGSVTELRRVDVDDVNDQHAYLRGSGVADLAIGDWIGFGVSHPCTTFDKWRTMVCVDDTYTVLGTVPVEFP